MSTLKIQVAGLKIALATASAIHRLEAVKEHLCDVTVQVGGRSMADPHGWDAEIMVDIPKATLLATVDKALADNHRILRDLGIELVP